MERENDHLKQQLEASRRAGRRQAAPFAKDRPQGHGKRPGRRPGAQYGRHGCRLRPARVDETHAAPVPSACPDCGGAVEVARVASQYQEDLPKVRPIVRRFDIEVGHCSQCRRRVQGRHALQTSDALGAAGAQLGPGVVALVVELHTGMGVPLAKVADLLRTNFNLRVTPSGLVHLLHRTARDAAPAYAELCEQVRNAPVVTPDETGWRVGADRHWLWAYATLDTTVYAICRGRGFDDAATVLGTDYAGVLVRDGWAPYRCFRDAEHQSCLAHLLRRCKELQEDHPDSRWGGDVQATLQAGLDLRDRCNAGELSEHGMATARGRLIARLGRLVDAQRLHLRFANHLVTDRRSWTSVAYQRRTLKSHPGNRTATQTGRESRNGEMVGIPSRRRSTDGHVATRRQAGASVRFPPRGIVLAVEAIRERNHRANATSSIPLSRPISDLLRNNPLNKYHSPGGITTVHRGSVGGETASVAYQTDAEIAPGNSGGLAVNGNGEMVGIPSAAMTEATGGRLGVIITLEALVKATNAGLQTDLRNTDRLFVDAFAEATYGTLLVQAGRRPEGHTAAGIAGGPMDVANVIDGCRGWVSTPPDYRIRWTGRAESLGITFRATESAASTDDTTLTIRTPDGRWFCNDDSAGSMDPMIIIDDPEPGDYTAWAGSYIKDAYIEGELLVLDSASIPPEDTARANAAPVEAAPPGRDDYGINQPGESEIRFPIRVFVEPGPHSGDALAEAYNRRECTTGHLQAVADPRLAHVGVYIGVQPTPRIPPSGDPATDAGRALGGLISMGARSRNQVTVYTIDGGTARRRPLLGADAAVR